MQAKLTDYYVNKAFTALTSIWTSANTGTNYTNVGGPLTATALKNSIDTINQTVGRVKAVVGTRKALTPITTFGAGWNIGSTSPNTAFPVNTALEEIYRTGWLGMYYGAPIVALDQMYDNAVDYQPMLPNNKVLVIGDNVGEFITYGPVREKAWDNMAPTPPEFVQEISTGENYFLVI